MLNPIVMAAIYSFVLTVVRANTSAFDILIGITVYNVYREAVMSGIVGIKNFNAGLKAERVRTSIFTMGLIGRRLVNALLISAGSSVVILSFFSASFHGTAILILLCLFSGILIEGAFINLAPTVRLIPDLSNIIIYVNRLLFFISPVMYRFDQTSGIHRTFNSYNPLTYLIEGARVNLTESSAFDTASNLPFAILSTLSLLTIIGYLSIDRYRWNSSNWGNY